MKYPLYLVFFLFSLFSKSQPYSITKGADFLIKNGDSYLTYIGEDGGNYYVLRRDNKDYAHYLCKFDYASSSLLYQKKIELKENEWVSETYVKNGKVLVLTKLSEPKTDRDLYLLHIINSGNGELTGTPNVVEEIKTKGNRNYFSMTLRFSPDSKKMLALLMEESRTVSTKITAKLYDTDNFKKIWEKQPLQSFDNSPTSFSTFRTDNAGRLIYLIAYQRPGGMKDDVVYGICVSEPFNAATTCLRLPSDNKTTINLDLEFIENELICTGEFLEGNNTPKNRATLQSTGFFMLSVDPGTPKILAQSYDRISSEVQSKLSYSDPNPRYRTEGIEKDNKLFKHFRSYSLDGALYVVNYHGYDYQLSPSNSMSLVNYHGNEIIVLKYVNGKLEWMQIIPRNTHGTGEYYYKSHTLQVVTGKKLHILYYDRKKNFENFPDPKIYEAGKYEGIATLGSETFPVCLTLDKFGNMTREIIPGDENTRLWNSDDVSLKNTMGLPLAPRFEKKAGRIDVMKFRE